MNIKRILPAIFFLLFVASTFIATSLTFTKTVSSACCPGEPGCGGTCYGNRVNPPGGCGCYSNSEGCSSCGGGNPPPPSCTASYPANNMTSVAPANGAIQVSKPVTLQWTNPTSWGLGCPNTNRNRILYKIKQGADCTAGVYTQTALFAVSTSRALDAELNWGTTYCWYVNANNGTYYRSTPVREFTTLKTPVFVGYAMLTDVCTNNAIGRYSALDNTTTNPANFRVIFQNPEPGYVLEWVALAMVVDSVNPQTWANVLSQTVSEGTFMYHMQRNSGVVSYHSYNPTSGGWNTAGAGVTTMPSATNSAVLQDLGTNTKLVISGNQVTADFNIQINNNFPSGTYGIYSMAYLRDASGNYIVSNDGTATEDLMMRRVGSVIVDTVPPSASFAGPAIQSNGTFNLTWNASDNINLNELYSYIYSDVAGSQIRMNTAPITTITTGGVQIGYPSAPNGAVTKTNLGLKNYTDLSPTNFATYSFNMTARDIACNRADASVNAQPSTPWILGTNGDVSGLGGIDRTRVPSITNFTVPFTTVTGPSYFSQFGSISGSTTNAKGTISKLNQYVNNYLDDATNSAHETTGLWYNFLLDKVKKNAKTPVTTLSAATIGGALNTALGATANTKVAKEKVGDLTVNASQCNLRALIFVSGNLTINPDLTITAAPNVLPLSTQTYNGCMFIVQGNVTIGAGTAKTPVLATASPTLAQYDIVNAYILTDGTFNAPVDNLGVGRKWDGLYINGGVVARNTITSGLTTIKRDINLDANNLQPATFFNLDPRYKLTFAEDFASRDFEVREFGL